MAEVKTMVTVRGAAREVTGTLQGPDYSVGIAGPWVDDYTVAGLPEETEFSEAEDEAICEALLRRAAELEADYWDKLDKRDQYNGGLSE